MNGSQRPMLSPNNHVAFPRVNSAGGLLNGIFWVLRSGAPWRFPGSFSPYTTCYNRFIPLAPGGRLEPHHRCTCRDPRCRCPDDRHLDRCACNGIGACIGAGDQWEGHAGGLTSKIERSIIDGNGLPMHLALSPVRPATFALRGNSVLVSTGRCCCCRPWLRR